MHYEQFTIFSQHFLRTYTADTYKQGHVRERVNLLNSVYNFFSNINKNGCNYLYRACPGRLSVTWLVKYSMVGVWQTTMINASWTHMPRSGSVRTCFWRHLPSIQVLFWSFCQKITQHHKKKNILHVFQFLVFFSAVSLFLPLQRSGVHCFADFILSVGPTCIFYRW